MRRLLVGIALVSGLVGLAPKESTLISPAKAAASDAVCMAGTTGGDAPGKAFVIMVSQQRVSDMQQRGLAITSCGGREANLTEYRSGICDVATRGSSKIIARFTNLYGISPSEMCTMADEILGS